MISRVAFLMRGSVTYVSLLLLGLCSMSFSMMAQHLNVGRLSGADDVLNRISSMLNSIPKKDDSEIIKKLTSEARKEANIEAASEDSYSGLPL
jgi:hypothetical protein